MIASFPKKDDILEPYNFKLSVIGNDPLNILDSKSVSKFLFISALIYGFSSLFNKYKELLSENPLVVFQEHDDQSFLVPHICPVRLLNRQRNRIKMMIEVTLLLSKEK